MRPMTYKRFTNALIAPGKIARPGLRRAMRTQRDLNILHSIHGVATEVGELMTGMSPFICGRQWASDLETNAREEMGDIGFYLSVLARALKVKLPVFTKKHKVKQAPLVTLLQLNASATAMLDCSKKTFYGRDINLDQVKYHTEQALHQWSALCLQLFHEPPLKIVEENVAKLQARYPSAQFNPDHEKQRDVKKEADAVAKV